MSRGFGKSGIGKANRTDTTNRTNTRGGEKRWFRDDTTDYKATHESREASGGNAAVVRDEKVMRLSVFSRHGGASAFHRLYFTLNKTCFTEGEVMLTSAIPLWIKVCRQISGGLLLSLRTATE